MPFGLNSNRQKLLGEFGCSACGSSREILQRRRVERWPKIDGVEQVDRYKFDVGQLPRYLFNGRGHGLAEPVGRVHRVGVGRWVEFEKRETGHGRAGWDAAFDGMCQGAVDLTRFGLKIFH